MLVATFTGAASSIMACFVAGTLVLTMSGLRRIEDIVAGDKILAADPDTLESAEKTVLETYVRKVSKLVHLTINSEEIVTTDNHPFYVQGRGFIEAGNLLLGDKLVSANGENLLIENYSIELTEKPVSVYNFQVEDFHTYFVGECGIWVHNAERCFSSSQEMYVATKNMPTEERIAVYKQEGRAVADGYGFEKNSKLSKLNSRDVYTDPKTKDLYALDTQHGTFEHCNKRGIHLEEVDFELNHTKASDKSGRHNLIVK